MLGWLGWGLLLTLLPRAGAPGPPAPSPAALRQQFLREIEAAHRAHNCTQPFRHCCPGRCRHFGQFHPDAPSFVRTAAGQRPPVAALTGLLDLLHASGACLVGFAGDSMMSDTMTALMCQLLQHDYSVTECRGRWAWTRYMFGENPDFCPQGLPVPGAALRLTAVGARRACPSLDLFYADGLAPADLLLLRRYRGRRGVLVANVGMHCNDGDVACLRDGVDAAAALAWALRRTRESELAILWKETEAQHFRTAAGNGLWAEAARGGECGPITNFSGSNWRNEYVARALRSVCLPDPIPVVPVHEASVPLWRLHSGAGDCTHYCYAPWIYHPLWSGVEQAARAALGAGRGDSPVGSECEARNGTVAPSPPKTRKHRRRRGH